MDLICVDQSKLGFLPELTVICHFFLLVTGQMARNCPLGLEICKIWKIF